MKKLYCLLLILVMVLVVAACRGPVDDTTPPETDPPVIDDPVETGIPEHEHVMEADPEQHVDATCTAPGLDVLFCTYPGCTETENKKLAKLEHVAVNEATCTADALCVCGKVMAEKLAHTYGEPVIVLGTCTEKGTKTSTCTVCGEVKVVRTSVQHAITTVVDATGKFAKDTCSLCGLVEKRINYETILFMDFETDDSMMDYLNSHEGFTYAQGTLEADPLVTDEATGNKYGYFKNANFFTDDKLAMLSSDTIVIEFDLKFDRFVSTNNASIFTLLPGWPNPPADSKATFAWLIKVNAERNGVRTEGELVTFPGVGRMEEAYINTGFVMEVEHWYHYTFIINWVTATAEIYVGDTGSGMYDYVATAYLDMADDDAVGRKDGVSNYKLEDVTCIAFRFCDGGSKSAFYDNFHIYTGAIPSWATAEIDSAIWPN